MGGVLPWTFFSTSLEMASGSLVDSKALLYSFSVSPFVVVAIIVLENFITFLLSFFLLTMILLCFYSFPLQNLYFFPFALLILFFFTIFTATFVAILNVFYRDVKFIVSFLLSILFFLTPILYPEDRFPIDKKWIITFNPIYKVIIPLRACIYDYHHSLDLAQVAEAIISLLFVSMLATLVWKKYRYEITKQL